MDFVVLLRYTTVARGEQCAMMVGIAWTPKLCADSLVTVAALHIQAAVKVQAVAISGWIMLNAQDQKAP